MSMAANEEPKAGAGGEKPVIGGQAGPGQGGSTPVESQGQEAQQPKPGETQPGSAPVAGEPGSAGSSPAAAPEGMSLQDQIAQAVKAATAEAEEAVKRQYEGPDGHMSKLRSSMQRQINELKRGLNQDSQRAMETAMQMAEKDPAGAIEMLAGTLQQYQERDQLSVREAQMAEWAERVIEGLELDPGDEEVLKVVEGVGPLTEHGADFELVGQLSQLVQQRAKQREQAAEAKLKSFEEQLPNLVRQQVATMMVESGSKRVDTSDPTTPAGSENPIANINSPSKLLAMAHEAAKKKAK